MAPSIAHLLRDEIHVSSLPSVYTRINEAVNDPHTSVADIGGIISEDPGLTGRLLRLVNSAFFGFPYRVETVSHACVIVGTRQLRDLALATSVIRLFRSIPADLVDMASFWRHSIACGMTAQALGEHCSAANPEVFFIAGILHDLGRLVIFQKLPEQARELLVACRSEGTLLYRTERRVLGFDHSDLAAELLSLWQLPPALWEPACGHHNPNSVRRFPFEGAVVHVADVMAHAMQWGSNGEFLVPPLVPRAWDRIGLSPASLPAIVERVEGQVEEVAATLMSDE